MKAKRMRTPPSGRRFDAGQSGADRRQITAAVTDQRTWRIALVVGLVPVLVVHLCYALSVEAGRVPLCLPYLEGCTSISRAARHGAAKLLFKAAMLPVAALLAVFWDGAARRLRGDTQRTGGRIAWMRALGIVGAAFLAAYVWALGGDGAFYGWMRRYGVTVYFAFTVLAQMLLAAMLPAGPARRWLTALCAAMLLLGLASIPLQHLFAEGDRAVNAIEWCYALLMSAGFVVCGLHWRRRPLRTDTAPP